jgi:hypothetical protein
MKLTVELLQEIGEWNLATIYAGGRQSVDQFAEEKAAGCVRTATASGLAPASESAIRVERRSAHAVRVNGILRRGKIENCCQGCVKDSFSGYITPLTMSAPITNVFDTAA